MASGISPVAAELEVMRKDDGSWHPCRISLSDDGTGIVVHYESCNEEYIISNREDALGRLRFRSIPLQKGDCLHLEEGHHVLAIHKAQSRTLFFDAVIEKPYRVKHSNRVHCRCNFEIKWLNPELKGEIMTVPSSSIMKLSKKYITSDYVLDAYLSSLSLTNRLEGGPPLCSLWEESDPDIDIYGLVQKIEETCLLGAKGGKSSGYTQNQTSRRSTRSQNKQEVEIKQKIQLEDKPQLESKSFLSPLAYRAALASFMHEREWKDNGDASFYNPKKHIEEHSSEVGSILLKSDASSHVRDSYPAQNANIYSPAEAGQISASSASNRRGSRKKSRPKCSPVLLTKLEISASASKLSETKQVTSITMENVINPVADEKLNGHAITARKTRSSQQKKILESTAEMTKELSNERNNRQISTRLAGSAKTKEVNSLSSVIGLGKNKPTEDPKGEELEGGICSSAIMERVRTPVPGGKLNCNALTSRKTRSAVQRQTLDSGADESSNRQMSTRLTRSTRDKEVNSPKSVLGLGKNKLAEASQGEELEAELCSSTTREHLRNSWTGGKLTGYANTSRMSRSAAHREIVDSTAEVVKSSSDEKLHGPVNTARLTRSAGKKEMDNRDIKQELGNIQLTEGLHCHESEGEPTSPTIRKHVKNPVTDGWSNDHGIASRMTRSAMQGEVLDSTPVSQGPSNENKNKTMSSSWLTCSEKKVASIICTKQELGNRKLTEDSHDVSVDHLGSPEKSESKKKNLSLPTSSSTESMHNNKKRARSTNTDPIVEDNQGKTSQNDSTPAAKKKVISSKKPELRFSPRLRFFPQTG